MYFSSSSAASALTPWKLPLSWKSRVRLYGARMRTKPRAAMPSKSPVNGCRLKSSPSNSAVHTAFEDALAVELPYGRKRALEIATTLALDPVMLLLDEPMAGLGQEDIGRISTLIRKVAAHRTVLMVEHNLSVVADLSDVITVLTRGRILAEGDYGMVSKNHEVMEAYLGTGHA